MCRTKFIGIGVVGITKGGNNLKLLKDFLIEKQSLKQDEISEETLQMQENVKFFKV